MPMSLSRDLGTALSALCYTVTAVSIVTALSCSMGDSLWEFRFEPATGICLMSARLLVNYLKLKLSLTGESFASSTAAMTCKMCYWIRQRQ